MSDTKVIATTAIWLLAILIGTMFGLALTAHNGAVSLILVFLDAVLIALFVMWWADYQKDFPDD